MIANWKMNKSIFEALDFVDNFTHDPIAEDVNVFCLPASVYLYPLIQRCKESNLTIGAQNFHWPEYGAYTGEVNIDMLTSIGIKHVLIGHSERRAYFGETDEVVNLKVKASLAANVIPIICVGESLQSRENGVTWEVITSQVTAALEGITAKDAFKVMFAYEPIWAIGTGKAASSYDAQKISLFLRELLEKILSTEKALQTPILYGGSVTEHNVGSFLEQPDVDGALIGGASLDPNSFANIIQIAGRVDND